MSDQVTGELHVPPDIVEALKAMPEGARKNLSLYQVDLLTRPFRQRIATLETAQSDEANEAALTAFAARCEGLEERVRELEHDVSRHLGIATEAEARADKAEAESERLREAISDYGTYDPRAEEWILERIAKIESADADNDRVRKFARREAKAFAERAERVFGADRWDYTGGQLSDTAIRTYKKGRIGKVVRTRMSRDHLTATGEPKTAYFVWDDPDIEYATEIEARAALAQEEDDGQ